MNKFMVSKKINKLIQLLFNKKYILGLFSGIAATTEHISLLKSVGPLNTIIDIGANKGQFSLIATSIYPDAKIFSFEPLSKPADKFKSFFKNNNKVKLFKKAIGEKIENTNMYVSQRVDSSSLLKILDKQTEIFPGTQESNTEEVAVAPLSSFLSKVDLVRPVFLKIDVQGFELEVLIGSKDLIQNIDFIYVECSFVELYENQALVNEIIDFLKNQSFKFVGIYNMFYDKDGLAIQGDLLFKIGNDNET